MEKPTHYYLNITDQDGLLIGRVCIDGTNLTSRSHRDYLGQRIESEMGGGHHVNNCADLPEVVEDDL